MSEWESRKVIAAAGIPVVEAKLVTSAQAAAEAAGTFGCAVALKVNGADIGHKTEIGGVTLDIAGPADAARAYDEILERVAKAAPGAHVDGVIVAPMVEGGIETILGIQVDPVFGPAVMFGLGGVFAEVLEDVSFRIAPIDRDEALRMIGETRGARLLGGVRGSSPADIAALADALSSLSEFAAKAGDRIESADLNPFVVLPDGGGAVALDCLVAPKSGT